MPRTHHLGSTHCLVVEQHVSGPTLPCIVQSIHQLTDLAPALRDDHLRGTGGRALGEEATYVSIRRTAFTPAGGQLTLLQ